MVVSPTISIASPVYVLRSIDECSSEWFGNSCRNLVSDITVTAAPVSNSNATGDQC